MKKNISVCLVFIFLVLSVYSKSKENLVYVKSEFSFCDVFFEEDKWILEEKITIKNFADKKITFEIERIFKYDYKNKFIAETDRLKGYADKDRKNQFFEIGANETKEFSVYIIGKNTGKTKKTNRCPVKKNCNF